MLPVGYFSMAIFLLSLLHVAFLAIHFQVKFFWFNINVEIPIDYWFLQVVTQCAKEKIMMVGESQFSYIMGVLFIQVRRGLHI